MPILQMGTERLRAVNQYSLEVTQGITGDANWGWRQAAQPKAAGL